MATLAPTVSHARDELIGHAGRAPSVGALFGETSRRLRRLVPYDSAVWLAFDPATGLPTAPTRAENLSHACNGGEDCMRVWELEFLVADVNLYRDLARADTPAGGLRLATDDHPARSARYRDFMRPNGFDDELRAVLRVDGAPWASVGLFRARGRPAFDAADVELVAGLSAPLASAVRDHAREAARADRGADRGPGLLLFGPGGELISVNDDALAWLEELPADAGETEAFGVPLPMVVAGTLMRAHAIAEGRDHGIARARALAGDGPLARVPRLAPARRRRRTRQHGARDRAGAGVGDRPDHHAGLRALAARAGDHAAHRARPQHRGHGGVAAPLRAHGARLRQGDLREGPGLQPRRAGGQAVRRALRPGPHGPESFTHAND
jgi:hypothetical protein